MLTYDYKCPKCGTTEEELVKDNTVMHVDCPKCQTPAARQLAAPRSKLDGTDPGFPDAYAKWADQHEKAGSGMRG